MKQFKFVISLLSVLVFSMLAGCTRVGTGNVGVKVGYDKEISSKELPAGGFYESIVSPILIYSLIERFKLARVYLPIGIRFKSL